MKSTKRNVIKMTMRKSRRDFSEHIPKAVEKYIRTTFKCSVYLAKQISKELIEEDVARKLESETHSPGGSDDPE